MIEVDDIRIARDKALDGQVGVGDRLPALRIDPEGLDDLHLEIATPQMAELVEAPAEQATPAVVHWAGFLTGLAIGVEAGRKDMLETIRQDVEALPGAVQGAIPRQAVEHLVRLVEGEV